jgi:hypothetical protein
MLSSPLFSNYFEDEAVLLGVLILNLNGCCERPFSLLAVFAKVSSNGEDPLQLLAPLERDGKSAFAFLHSASPDWRILFGVDRAVLDPEILLSMRSALH